MRGTLVSRALNGSSILFKIAKSSRSEMFFKIGVLKNFAVFTGKHLLESLFNKVLLNCSKLSAFDAV